MSYGAASVTYSEEADKKIELYTRAGFDSLPICMAKTQYRHAAKSPSRVSAPALPPARAFCLDSERADI